MNDNNIKTPDDYLEEDNWTWETMTKFMRQVSSLEPAITAPMWIWRPSGAARAFRSPIRTESSQADLTTPTKAMTQLSSWLSEGLMHGVGYDYRDEFNKGKVGLAITNDYGLQKRLLGLYGSRAHRLYLNTGY
ncbi:MAG: hypothetical protein ACLR56_09990 [Oscillospiraceae bacterium]